MKYGNRSSWKKYLASPFALAALLIIFGILVRATWNIHQKANAGSIRLAQTEAEFAKLQTRQTDLKEKVDKLSTDDGFESEIRTKYRAVKEGESVAVIIDDQKAVAVEASSTPQIGWFRRFLHLFGL